MNNRARYQRQLQGSRARRAIACAVAVLVAAGCAKVVEGRSLSALNDPFRVADLPAADGPSGPRPNAPAPTGTVEHTDNGAIDKLALLSFNDIQEYWEGAYSQSLNGTFKPVGRLASYDSEDRNGTVCGSDTYNMGPNAFFSSRCNLIAWDRRVYLPTGQKYFGDIAVTGVLAHEFGHALQRMAKLVTNDDPTLVYEQQADCFAGVFLYWVAAGKSKRFTLSTGNGLDHALAGRISSSDPVEDKPIDDEHGSALDRVSAVQMGFITGASACAAINKTEIEQRRGDLPKILRTDPNTGTAETGEVLVNEDTLSTLMEVMAKIFNPKNPPTLSYQASDCRDAKASPPASYCPATNTITVDLPKLQELAKVGGRKQHLLPQGDDTAISIVMSRYVLAVQHERGLPMQSPWTALRTACLTGYTHRKMAEPIDTPDRKQLMITAGDLDEAVSGLLTNRLVGSDADGTVVPAGFTRIAAFRAGVTGSMDACYSRYPA